MTSIPNEMGGGICDGVLGGGDIPFLSGNGDKVQSRFEHTCQAIQSSPRGGGGGTDTSWHKLAQAVPSLFARICAVLTVHILRHLMRPSN